MARRRAVGDAQRADAGYRRREMSATFIFLMLVLKLPIFGLFYIVWWAVQSPPEPEPVNDEDGGS